MFERFTAVILALVFMPCLSAAQSTEQAKPGAPSHETIELIKATSAQATRMNELIVKANQAIEARDWRGVEDLTRKLIEEDPQGWRYYQPLGNAQLKLGEYADAIQTYDKALELISKEAEPSSPERARERSAAEYVMLVSKGNCYLKLKKNDEAVAAYTKAAETSPNPALAYFNLCATQYNIGQVEGALGACEKAINADPQRADAYFIKASLLFAIAPIAKDRHIVAPPGMVDALKKYLELKPDGPHASDVKQMLEYVGGK
jgi:tetratricopeptide (TPR) repeat protein